MPPPQQLLSSCVSFKCLNLYLKVYLVLFILISALLPLSAPSDSISSSTSTSICVEALQWPDFCSVLKNSHLSDSALKELTRRELEAREMFCDMARLLTKIDCDQPYSVNQNQSLQCQSAYRDWACSMIAESIEVESGNDGKSIPSRSLIPSCDSICHRVLRVCPYLTPDRYQLKSTNKTSAAVLALHPSQYGGHPAFYCPTRSGLKFSALASRSNGGGSVSHQYFYRNASEVNLTDELISSNDTYCCWTYSEALKTEYVSLNENEPLESKNPFRQYDDDSPNQVLIQCLHAPSSDTPPAKEGQDSSDGTARESDFDKVASGGGGGGASSMVVADQSDPQPSTLALSRAIKAADMEVTEGDAGLLSGDSSEANYYLRDDWFDVSPRSKSIQKRNNYNFLSLVSSSSKQHEQQSSSSVLSSGEEDDSEGLYGGPLIDDDNENVGLLGGDHHQSELEIGKNNRKETRRSRQEAAILDEEFISTVSVRVERSILQGQIGDDHHHQPSSALSSAKSSASRQTLFIQFPVSLPTLKLPVITIHHNRCFPVLLFLLLIILLLLLMVLLTTNFLPILLLYTTPYVSSNFVVGHMDDDERDRRWRAGEQEMLLPASPPPVPSQLNSGLLVFREHDEVNFGKNNNKNEYYYYYYHYSNNNTYSGAMLKQILTVRSEPSQYLVYIKLMISSQVQPLVGKLNKLIQLSVTEKVLVRMVGAREHVVAIVDNLVQPQRLISVVQTSLLGRRHAKKQQLLHLLRKPKNIQGNNNNNQSINYYYNICPKQMHSVVTNELTHGVTLDTISRTEYPISRLRFVVPRLSSCSDLELQLPLLLLLFFSNCPSTPGCSLTVNMIRISLWPSCAVVVVLLTTPPTITRLSYSLTASNTTRGMRRRVSKNYCSPITVTIIIIITTTTTTNTIEQVTSRNFSRPLLLLVLLTLIPRLVLLLITILMLLISWSVVPHHHSIILITLLVLTNNDIMIRRGQSIIPKTA